MNTIDSSKRKRRPATLRVDLLASVVVFLVALPLSMGVAIASGVPVAAGLITAIVGGVVVGTLSGAPLQVSGPAAGLTVIVFEVVRQFGFEMLGVVVLIAGAFQLTAGMLRLGQWFRAVSPAVIKGMLAGIGVLIMVSQFHVMVDDKPSGSGLDDLLSIPSAIAKSVAIPNFEHQDVARFRMHALEQIGELHREQQSVRELVAETVPHRPGADTAVEVADVDLAPLLPEQQRIVEQFDAIRQRLLEFEQRPTHGRRSQQIIGAAAEAAAACENAQSVIRTNDSRRFGHPASGRRRAGRLAGPTEEPSSGRRDRLVDDHGAVEFPGVRAPPAARAAGAFGRGRLRHVDGPGVSVPVLYVEVPDQLWHEIHFPSVAVLREAPWGDLVSQGFFIAVIASAQTLLTAAAIDQMHHGPRANFDRELSAQGVGNILCGLAGALPIAGVIVRSAANIEAGAKTRWSAVFHGLWILVLVVGLPGVLRMIPTSSLAAILVYTGYKVIDVKAIRELWNYGWGEVVIYTATVVVIVVDDLFTGVMVGIVLTAVKLLYTFSHSTVDVDTTTTDGHRNCSRRRGHVYPPAPSGNNVGTGSARQRSALRIGQVQLYRSRLPRSVEELGRQHEANGGRVVVDWDGLPLHYRSGAAANAKILTAQPDRAASSTKRRLG